MAREGEVKVDRFIRGRRSSVGVFCISSIVSARSCNLDLVIDSARLTLRILVLDNNDKGNSIIGLF